jgi:hypothetical protein
MSMMSISMSMSMMSMSVGRMGVLGVGLVVLLPPRFVRRLGVRSMMVTSEVTHVAVVSVEAVMMTPVTHVVVTVTMVRVVLGALV